MATADKIPIFDFPKFVGRPGRRSLQHSVRAGIQIYPQVDPVFPDRRQLDFNWLPGSGATLRRLSWQKQIGGTNQIAGQWQVELHEKPETRPRIIEGAVLPGDWVRIVINRNGLVIPLCLGKIDSATQRSMSVGGATHRIWTLTGRDHGALFQYPIYYTNYWARTLSELTNGMMTERVKGAVGANPGGMFQILIDAAFIHGKTSSSHQLPPSLANSIDTSTPTWIADAFEISPLTGKKPSFRDILDVVAWSTRGAYYSDVQLWHANMGTLAQALEQWCNPLLNEIIVDLVYDEQYKKTAKPNAKVSAVIRERPFLRTFYELSPDLIRWDELPLWDIPDWAFRDYNIGRSDAERFNAIELYSSASLLGSESDQIAFTGPHVDRQSFEAHGIRPYVQQTRFVADAATGSLADWHEERTIWQYILAEWNALNPYELSGTAMVPYALPEVRIGQKLRRVRMSEAESEIYYIEGVGLEYSATEANQPPQARTVFTLTHGWRGTDRNRQKDLYEAMKRFEELKSSQVIAV